MTRIRISARDLAALFAEHKGRCDICGQKIRAGQGWQRSHRIPLAVGGKDEWSNWYPVHIRCHARQTAEIDAPLIAKVRRQYQKHIGAKPPSHHPMPGSRASKWKRTLTSEGPRTERR